MKLFRAIDDFLFDRCYQPIVNRCTWTNPVELSRFALSGVIVSIFARLAARINDGTADGWTFLGTLALALLVFLNYNEVGFHRVRSGRNYRRISIYYFRMRIAWVCFVLIDAIVFRMKAQQVCNFMISALFTTAYYFQACDEAPPPAKAWMGAQLSPSAS